MDTMFTNVDFGPLKKYLDDDDITDVSYMGSYGLNHFQREFISQNCKTLIML